MIFIALLACLSVCLAHPDQEWEDYKLQFGKIYTEEEESAKYETWKVAVAGIITHNAQYGASYKQAMNQFTDMTEEEFKAGRYCGLKIPEEYMNGTIKGEPFVPANDHVVPNSVDWRQQGYVTPVKNQGQCGSCYSFAASGALEGALFKKSGRLTSLTESQVVDCSGQYGNYGCRGGWYQSAWKYQRDCGGAESEAAYPYVARQGWCRFNRAQVVTQVRGFHDTRQGDENDLKTALSQVGPVSIAIDASRPSFRNYRSGVYYDGSCSSTNLDHAVLAVGYGTEGGRDYWLVKNSWGNWWGQGGYIKMMRNYYNHCGVASKPSYPIV